MWKRFTPQEAIFDYAEFILRVEELIKNYNRILCQSWFSLSLKSNKLIGSFEGNQLAHQLTRYAYIKRVKKLFFTVKLTNEKLPN